MFSNGSTAPCIAQMPSPNDDARRDQSCRRGRRRPTTMEPSTIYFRSFDWKRTDDRGAFAFVQADRDRARIGDFDGLVGATVNIDGATYVVRDVQATASLDPIRKGEQIALLVHPSPIAQAG